MTAHYWNKIAVVTTLFLFLLFSVPVIHAQDGKYSIIQADTLLQDIRDGKPIDRDWLEIQGDLDFTKLAQGSETENEIVLVHSSINLSHSQFDGAVLAYQDKLQIQFLQNMVFSEVIFLGDVKFSNTSFKGLADFSLSTFTKTAGFNEVDFAANVGFRSVNFQGSTLFSSSKFEGLADFSGAMFCKSVAGDDKTGKQCKDPLGQFSGIDFLKTSFKNDALFIQLQINTPKTVAFTNAHFDGVANFAGCRVSAKGDFAFNAVQFVKEKADFSYCKWSDTTVLLDSALFATLNLTGIVLENSKIDLTDTSYSTLRTASFDFDALINKRGASYNTEHEVLTRLETNFKANIQQNLANEVTFRRLALEETQKKGLWQLLDLVFYQQFAGYLVDISYPLKWTVIIILACGFVYGALVFAKRLKIVDVQNENEVKGTTNILFRLLTISLPVQPTSPQGSSKEGPSNGESKSGLLRILHFFKGGISWVLVLIIRLIISFWRGLRFSIRVFSEVAFTRSTAQSDSLYLRGAVKGLALLERIAGILLIGAVTYIVLYNLPALRILLGQ